MMVDENYDVTLRLDEKLFYTTKNTLVQESGYFAALLSGRWKDTTKDGVLTVDADADIFKHTLRFLRSNVLPVFYDGLKGFDHQLYSLLLQQAEYFIIDRLREWILEERYVQAVKIVRSVKVRENRGFDGKNSEFRNCEYTGDTKLEKFAYTTTRKFRGCPEVFECDRYGNPNSFSYWYEICSKIPEDGHDYVEHEVVNLVEISTKTVFDHGICICRD